MLLLAVILPQRVYADSSEAKQAGVTVKGIVADTKNEPLIGVSVAVKGISGGTMTGIDGDYTLSVPAGQNVLEFTYLGFVKQEVKIDGKTTINVVMQDDSEILDEVVVVGYGVQKKVNLTGAVSAVGANKLENRATTSLSTSLSGLAPGLNLTQKSGNPGSEEVSMNIRGVGSFSAASPMVLVDGAVADMNSVNPEDVESISVLKDGASAAIYGSRAANGVILITTKKGKSDEKPRVSYSSLFASQKAQTKWKLMSDMPTWMEWHNQAQLNNNPNISQTWFDQSLIDSWRAANANPNSTDNEWGIPNWMAYPNTDWAQEIFKSGFFQRHNVSVSGGGKTSNYLLSMGYQDNPGTFDNTGQKRYNIRANVETTIADRVKFGTQTYATKTKKQAGDTELAFRYLTQAYPGMNPEINGLYGASEDPNMAGMNNPLRLIQTSGGNREETTINTTWFARADIWNGLSAEVKVNYQNIFLENDIYNKNVPAYRFREGTKTPVEGITSLDKATTSRKSGKTESYVLNFLLYYNKTFGRHDINALAGYEQTQWNKYSFEAKKQGLIDWPVTDITSGSSMYSMGGDAKVDYAMISYFGRVNYSYDSKYLFEANFRTDGSSLYAPGHRWGYFPSFSGGWRISEEAFFEPVKTVIDDMKIRASWGKLGNIANNQYYLWQALYGKTEGVLDQGVSTGLGLKQPSNYTLKWETSATTDLGFDAYMLNKRLNIGFDYYYRKSYDVLDKPDMFLSMGNISINQSVNTANLVNKGIELSLNWNDKIDKVRYSVGFNVSYNNNKVTKYLGKLNYGETGQYDAFGRPIMGYTNLGLASTSKLDDKQRITEGKIYQEFYLNTPYKGSGGYYTSDGKVDPNGGPRDGMIRTKADLEWVKSMIAAGYKFNGASKVGSPGVDAKGNPTGGEGSTWWYGDQILADTNGDGIYGGTNDKKFTGKSEAPKWMFGSTITAEWNGFDFAMTWEARVGSYAYVNTTSVNGNISQNYDGINKDAASLYYTYDAKKSVEDYDNYDPATDPNANVNGRYPRLLSASSKSASNTLYLLNTSYLKLRSLQIGYSLPKKWLTPTGLSNVRIFFSGENLLTIKNGDFVGVDPELGASVKIYPVSRMLSGGLNVTF